MPTCDVKLEIPIEVARGLDLGVYWRDGGTVRAAADGRIVKLLKPAAGEAEEVATKTSSPLAAAKDAEEIAAKSNSTFMFVVGAVCVVAVGVGLWVAADRKKAKAKAREVATALARVEKRLAPKFTSATTAEMDVAQLEALSEELNAFLALTQRAEYRDIQIQMPDDRRAVLVGFCQALAAFNENLARELANTVPVPALNDAEEGTAIDVMGMMADQLTYFRTLASRKL